MGAVVKGEKPPGRIHQSRLNEWTELSVSWFGLTVRLVSRKASARFRFGSPFSSRRLLFVDSPHN